MILAATEYFISIEPDMATLSLTVELSTRLSQLKIFRVNIGQGKYFPCSSQLVCDSAPILATKFNTNSLEVKWGSVCSAPGLCNI